MENYKEDLITTDFDINNKPEFKRRLGNEFERFTEANEKLRESQGTVEVWFEKGNILDVAIKQEPGHPINVEKFNLLELL
jgi:hypothetical protein